MEEAPENGKESSHSAHANGINELMYTVVVLYLGDDYWFFMMLSD